MTEEAGAQLGGAEIELMLQQLLDMWQEVRQTSRQRGQNLEESVLYQQFLLDMEEEEDWIRENHNQMTVSELGEDVTEE